MILLAIMNRKELMKLCKEHNVKYASRMSKQEMIDALKLNDQDKSIDWPPNDGIATTDRKELLKLCKERKIKHRTKMTKQEMIEVLEWNEQDKSIDCHPNTRRKILNYKKEYRENNPDQREKEKERSRKWRLNNPEKAIEHLKKWQESICISAQLAV